MRKLWFIMIVSCFALAGSVRAHDKAETPPATAPAGEKIDATEIEKLKEAVGKTVTARGKVAGVFNANSGRMLINFEGADRDFVGMITKENADAVEAGFDGDLAKAIEGKTINITGEVKLFREKPQIEVTKPEQIKVEEEPKG
jgi:DNA/RNA endonuclease YhcR with UshA esterase domain